MMRPRYMTFMRLHRYATTPRSPAINSKVNPSCCFRSCSKLTTCAWIETSWADAGSVVVWVEECRHFTGHVAGSANGALAPGTVVEEIFGWPGVGRLLLQAISYRDYPIVQAATIIVAMIFVLVHFMVDVICAALDPRVRDQR